MMRTGRRGFRLLVAAGLLALLAAAVALGESARGGPLPPGAKGTCLGVPILGEEQLQQYLPHGEAPVDAALTFAGQPAAVDAATRTVYIPQPVAQGTSPADLAGRLACADGRHTLYFAPDAAFDDLAGAVRQGHPFTLLALDGTGGGAVWQVVFTTLPVLALKDSYSGVREDGRDQFSGSLYLWDPADAGIDGPLVYACDEQRHMRGYTSAEGAKKPWKLSLRRADDTLHLPLLGLGADDDWLLNPMNMDDLRLREKLFMALWNEMAADSPWDDPMSEGGYVELVLNGEYQGLYLLQRRVDKKYLELAQDTVLLKGVQTWEPANAQEGYRMIFSGISEETAWQWAQTLYQQSGPCPLDMDNLADTELLLSLAGAGDNVGYKNMYYILQRDEQAAAGWRCRLLPWDTDMSFGITWHDAFAYDPTLWAAALATRMEHAWAASTDPAFLQREAARWQQLRQGVLGQENILAHLEALQALIDDSGALARDRLRWGERYGGEDTLEALRDFLIARLAFLDEKYAAQGAVGP